MKKLTLFTCLILFQSCNYLIEKKGELLKEKINRIENIIGIDNSNYKISDKNLSKIFKKDIHLIKTQLSSNIYCGFCDDPYAKIDFKSYHLNMKRRCIEYNGNCLKCKNNTIGCFSILDRLEIIEEIVKN